MKHLDEKLERLSRWLTHAVFAIAIISAASAPLLAIAWVQRPFPGFTVEHTLVVNDQTGSGWLGKTYGIVYSQRVARIAGVTVNTPAEFDAVLSGYEVGQQVSIFTIDPAGMFRLYPAIPLQKFDTRDMIRIFWLPYLIGLVYLGIGVWVYRLIGKTKPGRALSAFCGTTSIAAMLVFDLSTTHLGVIIWMTAISQIGGTLISLAMRFPEEWRPVSRWPWVLGLPYVISLIFTIWGVVTLRNPENPWAYITAWGVFYRFTAFGILFFIAVMIYHTFSSASTVVRQQARIIVLGSLMAFFPITLFFLAPLFKIFVPFNPGLLMPFLVIFPFSVVVAITRYRLWEFDTLVNRAIVYGLLTAILAGVFTALTTFSQRVFIALTGERSDAALVITTFIVGSAAAPIRSRLQVFVDRQFRRDSDDAVGLKNLEEQVRTFLLMNDPEQLSLRLLDESVRNLHAEAGALRLHKEDGLSAFYTVGSWRGEAALSMPIEYMDNRYGLLFLGPKTNGQQYSRQDVKILRGVVHRVAHAIHLASGHGFVVQGNAGIRLEKGVEARAASVTAEKLDEV